MNNFYKKAVATVVSLGVLCIGQVAIARISNPGSSSGAAQTPIAQNVDYATFNLFNTGKIGIATSTLTNLLTIDDSIGNYTNGGGISFWGSGSVPYYLYHDGSDLVMDVSQAAGNQFKIESSIGSLGVSDESVTISGLPFHSTAMTADAVYINASSEGKIGIGTSTPFSYLDIRGTGSEENAVSAGISLSTNDSNEFYLYTDSGTFTMVSKTQYNAGIGTGVFKIEGAADGEISIGNDSAYTGSIIIGTGDTATLTLDSDTTRLQGDVSVTISGGNTYVSNFTETGTVFASSSVNASEQMLPADIEHGLIEFTPNTESISLLLPAVSELPTTFIPTAGDRKIIQLFNATTTSGITIQLDANGDTDWLGSANFVTQDTEILKSFLFTRLSDGRIYVDMVTP